MAQVRANWFPHLRTALVRLGLRDAVEPALSQTTKQILGIADEAPRSPRGQEPMWFDEGHAVSVYEAVAAARSLAVCRDLGRDAARIAMRSTWRDLIGALFGHLGGTPRMAFEQLPVLWNATRRDAGDVRCLDSSTKHATTEVRGFVFAGNVAWRHAWLGHHDALLRELRFSGHSTLEEAAPDVVRVRVTWSNALGNAPTGGFGPP